MAELGARAGLGLGGLSCLLVALLGALALRRRGDARQRAQELPAGA